LNFGPRPATVRLASERVVTVGAYEPWLE
jgi:hypothetical protein